jgi:hypothetical protein
MESPIAETESHEQTSLVPRPDTLEGARVGLYRNAKKAAEPVSKVVEERLSDRYPTVEFRYHQIPARNEKALTEIGTWAREDTDVCIAAMADCGGCTRSLVRATNAIEEGGTPAVGLIAEGFELSWQVRAEDMGRPLRCVPLPIPSETTQMSLVQENITTELVDSIEEALTNPLTGVEKRDEQRKDASAD